MQHPPSDPNEAAQLMQIARSLHDLRDSLVMISLTLTDLITEAPSPERDEVLAGVKCYLNRIAVLRH
jgi:hypothetical protein